MDRDAQVLVAGSETSIGSALLRGLTEHGCTGILRLSTHELRALSRSEVCQFFEVNRPVYVVDAAGATGGIATNQRRPADLCLDNLLVTAHLLDAARQYQVKRLLYLASSCCYPRDCAQPMRVADLWSGRLEPTNEAYAAAKLAGIALCRAYRAQYNVDFRVGVPANAYGPGDECNENDAHVVMALIRRMHEARERSDSTVTIWGTGRPRRELIYVDDLASACWFVMQQDQCPEIINLGSGCDITISDLAAAIRQIVGYRGLLEFDETRSDGMPQKLLDSSPLTALGFRPRTSLEDGLSATYSWYRDQVEGLGAPYVG